MARELFPTLSICYDSTLEC